MKRYKLDWLILPLFGIAAMLGICTISRQTRTAQDVRSADPERVEVNPFHLSGLSF